MKQEVKALVISVDGTTEIKTIKQDLDTLQDLVYGNLEFVSLDYGHLYCNEDGYALGLSPNAKANALAKLVGWFPIPGDYLKGTIVFLGTDYVEGNEDDVPDQILELCNTL